MITKNGQVNSFFEEALADLEICESTIRYHSKSFYKAFSRLPRQRALSVYAIYAFCREADDSIDVHQDPNRLAKLKEELTDFINGEIPDRAFWRALVPVFKTYQMNSQAFFDMISGQEKDIAFQQPANQKELEDYAYDVAGTVGLMLLPILSDAPTLIREEAIQLGKAMQLTNILRDVGEDYTSHRIYLPKDVMRKYGVSDSDLAKGEITEKFIKMWEYEAKRAEVLYNKSMLMLPKIVLECREALLLALMLYKEILNSVRKNDYQCLTTRNYVKKEQQLTIYLEVKKQLKRG